MRIRWVIAAMAALACSKGESAAPAPPPASSAPPTSNATSATPDPTSTSTAPPTPDPAPTPPPTPEKRPVPVTAAIAEVQGRELPLARDGVTLVDPAATYRIEVDAHLVDGRLSLHDEADAMVASRGTAEADGRVTRYHLAPLEPLVPGSAYTLVLDGAVTRDAHDGDGRAFTPVVVRLKTVGEKPAPVRKRAKRR